MAFATLDIITEEIQRIYRRALGSDENVNFVIDRREIKPIVDQVVNELLSITIQNGISNGGLSIPSCAIATYGFRNVLQEDGRWKADIDVHPINLPRNMGVWHVCSQTCVNPGDETPIYEDEEPMIPISSDDWDLLRATELHDSGLFEDQIGYYVEGLKIYFTSAPPTTNYGLLSQTGRFVKVKLLISSSDIYGDNTTYPVPADMVSTVVNRVLDILKMNTSRQQEVKQQDR